MKRLAIIICLLAYAGVGIAQAQQKVPPAPYGMSALDAYSVFHESYKNKDYQTALIYGRWLVIAHPKKIPSFPQYDGSETLSQMIDIYTSIASKKDDPTVKTTYLDSAAALYNKVFALFTNKEIDEFSWRLQQGRFYQEHSTFLDSAMVVAMKDYTTDFTNDPKRLTQISNGYYVKIILQNLVSNNNKDEAQKIIQQATPYADADLKKFFDEMSNRLYSTPGQRIAYLKSKIASNPDDTASMEELYNMYQQTENYTAGKDIAQKLYAKNPNFKNTMQVAKIAEANADYKTSVKYYKEAMQKASSNNQKKQVALTISQDYLNLDDLQTAREYARQAIRLDPKWGEPYIDIAKIYAQAVNDCSGQVTRKDKVVYWLVLDYLEKAKRIDPSVASQADQLIKTYEPVTPTQEDIFFQNWKKGAKMKVDSSLKPCYAWINETTTVR